MRHSLRIFVIATLALSAPLSLAELEGQIVRASDGVQPDNFGSAVDIDGGLMIVGAHFATIDGSSAQGAAYIFEESGGSWSELIKLVAPDGVASDSFGSAVAISGDTVVVGAKGADNPTLSEGAAYVFQRDSGGAGNWGMVKKLAASTNVDLLADCGDAVAIDGDTVAMGCRTAYSQARGALFVYERDEGGVDNWGVVQDLGNDVFDSNASFGASVDISGDVMAVGLENQDLVHGSFENEGAITVFTRNAGLWTQSVKLFASDAESNARLGSSVAIDGDVIVGGAPFHDVDALFALGHAYVFEKTGPNDADWTETAILDSVESTQFSYLGRSVGVFGDDVVVGATGQNGVGKGYRFVRDGSSWSESTALEASDAASGDSFASSGTMGNGWTILGSPLGDEGAVYVYGGAPGLSGPGSVPATSLVLDRAAVAGDVRLSWSASCATDAVDYGIYEGTLGSWYSHSQLTCTDSLGDLSEELTAGAGSRYFLVVPNTAAEEGAYGRDGDGVDRPVGLAVCAASQLIEVCP